jgi:hypothetical protein
LTLYATHPIFLEQVFDAEDQHGVASAITATTLEDVNKLWIRDSWIGGRLRVQGQDVPIVSNSRIQLTVEGALLPTDDPLPYTIIPGDVARLQQYLTTRAQLVELSYARVPTQAPVIHLRLESDRQATPEIGESIRYTVDPLTGQETTWLETEMEATYLLSVVTQNPQETVWLYQLLTNAYLGSQPYFARAGFHNITMTGSDVHPDLAYLPEQVYARYIQISFTRFMQAVLLDDLAQITDIGTTPDPRYQTLDSHMDPPGALPSQRTHVKVARRL